MLTLLFKLLLGSLALPPGNGLFPLLLAALFRRRRWAFGLALCGGGLLLLQALPLVSGTLMATLEDRAGPPVQAAGGAQAIVILGSGLIPTLPEFGGDTASERTLVRVRNGARLARRFELPVLVAGGTPLNAERSEAEVMAELLEQEFGVAVRWREDGSMDTADNARLSANILQPAGIRRIVLVTQAFHMPRARFLFERAGFEVVPAPVHFVTKGGGDTVWLDFLPRVSALQESYYAEHEWLGLLWARLTFR